MVTAEIRESQRELMARKRAAERDLEIPAVRDPKRRAACEFDDCLWLQTYLPAVFYNPFTSDQRSIIGEVGQALRYGNSKCIAAPRGDGKSSITKYLTLKYALYRQIRFGLIICATGPKADSSLKSIKAKLRLPPGSPLHDDFPFECAVGRYVASAPAKANNVTVNGGRRVHVEWAANQLILPTLADDGELGPIIMSLGYESEQLQGCNVFDVRPDFVMLDDLDSRESLAAVDGTIAAKIETIIDQNVGGLGGPGRRLGQVYLCTITSRNSAAFKYSDPQQKSAYSGVRMARIRKWPARLDLWEEYIEMRQSGQNTRIDPKDESSPPIDPFGRKAHQFLVDHYEEMHVGAELSNPYDFTPDELPDGTPTHLSALQKCYDYIADKGVTSFLTEHQNDPPEAEEVSKAGINRQLVRSRLSGLGRRELPPDATIIVGIDIGKMKCFWTAAAFRKGGIANVIDYGVIEVHGTESTEQKEVIEQAILRALIGWKDEIGTEPFRDANGSPVAPDKVLIDSGYSQDAAFEFVRRYGEPFRACKGKSPFTHGTPGLDRRVGNHWFAQKQKQASNVWLYTVDADYWKRAVHERFIAEPIDANGRPNPGSLTLFIPAGNRDHETYSAHILAEEWITEFIQDKGEKSHWRKHSANNHYYDATALCLCGGEMAGMGMFANYKSRPAASARPTARQLAGQK